MVQTELQCVGSRKLRHSHHEEHSWGGGALPLEASAVPPKAKGGITKTTSEQLYFQLKEFDEFRSPSFNTLYVQIPKPPIFKNPFVAGLAQIMGETWELLQPVMRFGIPKNSLKDKLPHFREDYSPLPNNVRPRVQKLLKANIQFAEQMAAASAQAAEEWRKMKAARKQAKKQGNKPLPVPKQLEQLEETFGAAAAHGHGPHGHHIHIAQPHFYTHEMPIWVVPALNLAAYWYLCGLGGLFRQ